MKTVYCIAMGMGLTSFALMLMSGVIGDANRGRIQPGEAAGGMLIACLILALGLCGIITGVV